MNFYDILLARALCCKMGSEEVPLEVTENGQYIAPEGKAFNPVTVNVSGGGGGGGSDFSTAQVTIVDNIGDGINLELPVLYEEGEAGEGAPAYVSAISMSYTSGVYNVVLYKGNLLLILSQEQGVTTSGSITKLQSSAYLISGDCTITISQ